MTTRALLVVVTLLIALVAGASAFRTMHLGKSTHPSPPRSQWLMRHGEGATIATGGSIWPTSIFWTTVQVGTPEKTYAVAIDSGSNALFLSAKGCKGCVTNHPNIPYVPTESSTSQRVFNKTFSYAYETCNPTKPLESCTIAGPYFNDVVSLAGFGPKPIMLGAIESQTDNFYQFHTIDGIMGMVGGPVNQSVFLTLCVDGHLCEPVFGICMHEGTHSNGTMTVGGVDESLSDGPIEYVPSTNHTSWHEIAVNSITFGSGIGSMTIPGIPGQRGILDTGTNDLLLPTLLYKEAEKAICGYEGESKLAHCHEFFNQSCFDLTDAEVAAYPDLSLNLDLGVKLHMTSKDYLLKNSPAGQPGQYCFGIADGGGYFIIGDTTMQNYYLVFATQKVGWGKVNKNTCGSKAMTPIGPTSSAPAAVDPNSILSKNNQN